VNILRLAVSFLTIVPAYSDRADEKEMALSLYYYPVVGFLIGAGLALIAWLSNWLQLGWGGDAVVIVSWIVISGGLHLDGLMDSADGLFSGRERDKKLEIMKDSRVGAMGGIALVSVVLLKFALLTSIPYPAKLGALLIAPAMGRCMMVAAILLFPYARTGPGLGKCFGPDAGKEKLWGAIAFLLLGTILAAQLLGFVFIAITALLVSQAALWINNVLGGQTGDTYGALCEITETVFLLTTAVGMALYSLL